jgi:hypothetical protein
MLRPLCVFLSLFLSLHVFAQRHIKNSQGFELLSGASKYGQVNYLGYVRFFSEKLYMKTGLYYGMDQSQGLKHSSIGLDGTLAYTLVHYKNIFFANAIGGITGAYDQLTSTDTQQAYPTMKFGVFAGIEAETFFNNKFSFVLNANERAISGQAFGSQRWYATAGFRFHFFR